MSYNSFISGLDLGQVGDFSALCITERVAGQTAREPARYRLQKIRRFDLGTPYTAVCERVAQVFSVPPLAGTVLAVDGSGVGRALVDMLRRQHTKARLEPIVITGGHNSSRGADGYFHVPKKDLVAVLHVVLGSGRLEVASDLPERQLLLKELRDFKVYVTKSANEIYEAREGQNDDLVLAVAMAIWIGERPRVPYAAMVRQLRQQDDD
jgi:hypothetical protein